MADDTDLLRASISSTNLEVIVQYRNTDLVLRLL